jgi:hypothetical protein
VRLQTDAVNRHVPRYQVRQHRVHGVRFGVHAFRAVIVVVQQRIRVGFMREAERHFNVIFTDHAQPRRIAVAAVVVNRLVDHIPQRNASLIAPDHRVNVIAQDANRFFTGEASTCEPTWHTVVPQQRVSVNRHIVRFRECHQSIQTVEHERSALRLQNAHLGFVLRRQHVEFPRQRFAMHGIVEMRCVDRRADPHAVLLGKFAQRGLIILCGAHRHP